MMKATVLSGAEQVAVHTVADPTVLEPTDAVVKVLATCVCGSDLWYYRGINPVDEPVRMGHEMVAEVVEVGSQVTGVTVGDVVISPFTMSCMQCPHCLTGMPSACQRMSYFGAPDRAGHPTDACQGEYVRVPLASGTLVPLREHPDASQLPSLLTLADVMCTGWHGTVAAGVKAGDTVVVVGDGAVGLCAVLSASMQGAERVVAMSRHQSRQELARRFGATHIIAERGKEGAAAVAELTEGVGADAVVECVGTHESMAQAFASARPGSTVGFVGVPHDVEVPVGPVMFRKNIGLAGGMAPARTYIPQLLEPVLAGEVNPGLVFDLTVDLDHIGEGYAAMDERRAIKALVQP